MELHVSPNPPPPLPPGCRFHPTDHQLLTHYLPHKTHPTSFDPIKDLDVFTLDPFNLPVSNCFMYCFKARRRQWYCYTVGANRERLVRRTESGFWRRKGKVKDVVGAAGVVIGRKVGFVFYMEGKGEEEEEEEAVRTDWLMHQYEMVEFKDGIWMLNRGFWGGFWKLGFSEGLRFFSGVEVYGLRL